MKTIKNPSGVYVVRIQTEHGRRTISTGTKSLEEAQKIIRGSKVRELELTAKTVRLTQDVVAQIVTGRKVTVCEAIEEWSQWMESSHKTPRTAANYLLTVRAWARDMKVESTPVGAVTKKEIDRWINAKDENKASWKRMKLSYLRQFFDFCTIRTYRLGDPSKEVGVDFQKMSHAQKELREARVFSDEEVDQLLAYCRMGKDKAEGSRLKAQGEEEQLPPSEECRGGGKNAAHAMGQRRKWEQILEVSRSDRRHWQFWEFAIVFGRYTGLRLGDICQLEWDCFQPMQNEKLKMKNVVVWTDKRNRRVQLPMGPETVAVFEALERERSWTPSKYLFPERREQVLDVRKRSKLSAQFSRLAAAAGVTGHVFHELRATYASDFVKQGNSMELAAKALGHAHTSTTEGYVKK